MEDHDRVVGLVQRFECVDDHVIRAGLGCCELGRPHKGSFAAPRSRRGGNRRIVGGTDDAGAGKRRRHFPPGADGPADEGNPAQKSQVLSGESLRSPPGWNEKKQLHGIFHGAGQTPGPSPTQLAMRGRSERQLRGEYLDAGAGLSMRSHVVVQKPNKIITQARGVVKAPVRVPAGIVELGKP